MSNRLISRAVLQRKASGADGLLDWLFAAWFHNFVYNQIWEDPAVDLEALDLTPESRIVTIASGGCNILNYLVAGPRSITAVDLNPAHVALAQLKLAAVRHFPDHDAFFRFFGSADEASNLRAYVRYLRPNIDEETRRFWEGRVPFVGRRINYFVKGLYNHALLGKFIGAAHRAGRFLGGDPGRLLSATSLAEQQRIFDESVAPVFERRMVRALCHMPLSFYSLGIPPAQYEALKRDAGGDIVGLFRERLRRLACDFPIHRTDGQRGQLWRVLDYGPLIIHVMDSKTREFYSIEKLWDRGRTVELKKPAPAKKPAPKKKPVPKKKAAKAKKKK